MNRIVLSILLLSPLTVLICLPQQPIHEQLTPTQRIEYTEGADDFDYQIVDIAAIDTFIVEFTEEPLFVSAKQRTQAFYQEVFNQFQSDLDDISAAYRTQYRGFPDADTGSRFYKLFFGVTVTAPHAVMMQIEQLDYVKRLHRNLTYEATISESVPFIGADRVWQDYGATGEGVVVAVLDTGIDYTHPALGEGFGTGFKVIGGYDFVGHDDDPMDENDHGTHVAGIIAAQSDSLIGVAPDASLMAVRVLDRHGFGSTTCILQGIEYCADPNGDNDFTDHVDIVNASLGSSSGNLYDAVSIALDNAAALGVTFCVAAGNNYEFMTIDSPACAAGAIAVGATTLEDGLCSFSSEGPNDVNYAIKPDLCAPGYEITSSVIGGGTEIKSGTSMAAPHVSGVSALIKQLHPDWNPEKIRSAMVNNAVELDLDIMQQGGGRIDAMTAVNPEILFEPAVLNFGPDTTSVNGSDRTVATFSKRLQVTNVSDEPRTLDFSAESPIDAITLHFSPQSLTLSPNESQEILVQLDVDNGMLGIDELDVFTEWVTAGSDDRYWKLPWTITKLTTTRIHFYRQVSNFFLFNDDNYYKRNDFTELDLYTYELQSIAGDGYTLFLRVSDGENKFLCVPDIVLEGSFSTIDMSEEPDFNSFTVNSFTPTGDLIEDYGEHFYYLNIFFPDNRNFGFLNFDVHQFEIMDMPEDVQIVVGSSHWDEQENFHVTLFDTLYGIDQDITIENDPNAFVESPLEMSYFGWDHFQINPMPQAWTSLGSGYYLGISFPDTYYDNRGTWNSRIFMQGDYSVERGSTLGFFIRWLSGDDYAFGSPPSLRLQDDRIAFSSNGFPSGLEPGFPIGETLFVGHYPFLVNIPTCVMSGEIDIDYSITDAVGTDFTYRESHLPFTLRDQSGNDISTGWIGDDNVIAPSVGSFELEMNFNDYSFDGEQGNTRIRYRFDTNQVQKSPPVLNRLLFTDDNGTPLGSIDAGETVFLRFALTDGEYDDEYHYYDPVSDDNVSLSLRVHGDTEWLEFPFEFTDEIDHINYWVSGRAYSADISELVVSDSCLIDLRIEAADAAGNSVTYTAEPAFGAGDHVTAIGSDTFSEDVPAIDRLLGNYPNPFNPETNIRFSLAQERRVTIDIYNIKGQRVKRLLDDVLSSGAHKITWQGKDRYDQPVSSGVYFIRMRTDGIDQVRKALLLK